MFPYNWYYLSNNMYNPMMGFNPSSFQDFDDFENDLNYNISQPIGDPPPIVTNPPATTAIVLRKELSGYPNYGNPSGNADILYTGTQATYTFDIPSFLSAAIGRFRRVELVIRGALDDHYNVPENRYSMTATINGVRRAFPNPPFVHGRPAGQQFTNWNQLTIPISPGNIRRNNRIVIRNTSRTGDTDFIAFDWIEMRFYL